jgi:uncharacterized protein YjbI with pentapeptide repeats
MSLPTIIIRIRRVDLIEKDACPEGLKLFDAIAQMQGNPKRVRMRWSQLAQAWLMSAYPSFASWLVNQGMIPRANLSRANLFGANLSYANLSYANLSYANLSYANLSYANLSYANLSGANLSGADLSYANLSRAYLSGAYLSGANLGGCYWPKTRPAPDGWTHDPPVADRVWVILRRKEK